MQIRSIHPYTCDNLCTCSSVCIRDGIPLQQTETGDPYTFAEWVSNNPDVWPYLRQFVYAMNLTDLRG